LNSEPEAERIESTLRERVWRHVSRDASGAIYGTIITASTIAALTHGVDRLLEVDIVVAVTLALYAVAHAYCHVLGGREGAHPSVRAFGRELVEESTMATACVLPLLVMVVAGLLGAGVATAVWWGLWMAVAMLFFWGFVAARKVQAGRSAQILSAAGFGLVGFTIVALRVATSHRP
jgi:hypothetical protein